MLRNDILTHFVVFQNILPTKALRPHQTGSESRRAIAGTA